jgi:hypothetical protein
MRMRSIDKRKQLWIFCTKTIDLLKPIGFSSSPGPPVFLDSFLQKFNDTTETSVFPDQFVVLKSFSNIRPDIVERSYFVMPGEFLTEKSLWNVIQTELANDGSRFAPYLHKEKYISDYANRRCSILGLDRGEPDTAKLLRYFQRMTKISAFISKSIDGEVTFVVKGKNIGVSR